MDYMSLWNWRDVAFRYKYLLYDGLPEKARREVIIITEVIPHRINRGYERMFGMVVEAVNGMRISVLSDVVRALEKPLHGRHIIEVDNHRPRLHIHGSKAEFGRLIVFDSVQARQATREILDELGIPSDRSEDLGARPIGDRISPIVDEIT
jgi:hypothetical protein